MTSTSRHNQINTITQNLENLDLDLHNSLTQKDLENTTFECIILKDIKQRLSQGQGETHYTINDDAWKNHLERSTRLVLPSVNISDIKTESTDSGRNSSEDENSNNSDIKSATQTAPSTKVKSTTELDENLEKIKNDITLAENYLTEIICKKLNLNFQILRKNDDKYPKIDFLLRRRIDDKDFIEVRVAVIGNVDAGKSTVLGVLTHAELDNGRGYARQKLFRHRHELESGRTSAVGSEILGFDSTGQVVNKPSHNSQQHPLSAAALNNLWQKICKDSSKIVNFIDLAGHEKYLKTTVFGMTGHLPDFCMLIVGSNQGVVGMSKEHLGLALNLNVPVFIVVTKIDMCPANILENTMKTLKKLMRAPSVRKMPLEVKTQNDVVMAAHHLTERICPIFQISNVTGQNLDLLKSFFNMLTSRSSSLKNAAGTLSLNIEDAQSEKEKQEIIKAQNKVELLLDDSFSVAGVGTVVSGTVLSGVLRSNTTLMFGPDKLGKFMPIDVRTLQRRRLPVDDAHPGQTVAVAVRKVKRRDVRKGQVLISRQALEEYKVINKNETNGNVKSPLALTEKDKLNEKENATYAPWEFLADVVILHHPTTISLKYQAMIHIGSVRQTGVIKWMDKEHLRTGDKARVRFMFMKHPEFIRDGQKFVFREGRTKAVGVVVERLNTKGKNMCGNISGDNVDGGQGSRSSKSRARAGQRFELKN